MSLLEDMPLSDYINLLKSEIKILYDIKNLNNSVDINAQQYYKFLDNNQSLKKYINLKDIEILNDAIGYINSDYATFKSDEDLIIDKDDKLHELYENVMILQRMSNPCKNNCIGGCEGNCSIQCADYCGINCEYQCDGSCINLCSSSCALYCMGACSEGCMGGCYGMCYGTCNDACRSLESIEAGKWPIDEFLPH